MTISTQRNLWNLPNWGLMSEPEPFSSVEIPRKDAATGVLRCLAWNRDGTLLAAATDEGLFLSPSQQSGEEERPEENSIRWKMVIPGVFNAIIFRGNNRFVLVDRRGMILPCLFREDLLKVQVGKALPGSSGRFWLPAFSEDGSLLVAPTDGGGIGLYFPYGSEADRKFLPETGRAIEMAAISPNKKWLAYSQASGSRSEIFVFGLVLDDGDNGLKIGSEPQRVLEYTQSGDFTASFLLFDREGTVLYVGGSKHQIKTFIYGLDPAGSDTWVWVEKTHRHGGGAGRVNAIEFWGGAEEYMVSVSDNRTLCLWHRGHSRSSSIGYDAYWVVSHYAGEQVAKMAFHPKKTWLVAHRAEEERISFFAVDTQDIANRKQFTKLQAFKVLLVGDEPEITRLFEKFLAEGKASIQKQFVGGSNHDDINIIRVNCNNYFSDDGPNRGQGDQDQGKVWREVFFWRLPKLKMGSAHDAIRWLLLRVYIQNADLLIYVAKDPLKSGLTPDGISKFSNDLRRWVRVLTNAAPRRGSPHDDGIPWLLVTQKDIKGEDDKKLGSFLADHQCREVVEIGSWDFPSENMEKIREAVCSVLLKMFPTGNIVKRNSVFPIFRGFMRERFYAQAQILPTATFLDEANKITPGVDRPQLERDFNSFRVPATRSGWMTTAPDKDLLLINRYAMDALLAHLLESAVNNQRKDGAVFWDEWVENSQKSSNQLVSRACQLGLREWVWSLCEREQLAAGFETVLEDGELIERRKMVFSPLTSGRTFPTGGYLPAPKVTYSLSCSEDELFHNLVIKLKIISGIKRIDAFWQNGMIFSASGDQRYSLGFYFGLYERKRDYCDRQEGNRVVLNLFYMGENIPTATWQLFQDTVETLLRTWAYDSLTHQEPAKEVIAERFIRFFCTNRECGHDELDSVRAKEAFKKGNPRETCQCGAPIELRSFFDVGSGQDAGTKQLYREEKVESRIRKHKRDFSKWLLTNTSYEISQATLDGLTVVFTDIKGSMDLLAREKEEGWFKALMLHFDRANALLEEFRNGYMVKNMGDGFVFVFTDTFEALNYCAQLLKDSPRDKGIQIRASMHSGPVYIDTEIGDIFGVHVGLTARIMELHKGAVILASQVALDKLKNHPNFEPQFSTDHIASVDKTGNRFVIVNEARYTSEELKKVGKGNKVDSLADDDEIKVYLIDHRKAATTS
ncbi:MAG: hypothetical protein HQL07_00200 [Nitrospirae bacterium]|nr:hypothetical protein [Magnetococcales bacterium]HAT49642.1 hypothetical protein [Alphaproteobacteria bacterium]